MKNTVCTSLRHLRGFLESRYQHVCFVTVLAVSATVVVNSSPAQQGATPTPKTGHHAHHWLEIGKASWYGRAFQGRRTATGERFDMNALTCAHRTLPLGSWLRITNLRNSRSTFVRVNDRGPYQGDAIVDLSYAAAQKVGLFGKGQVRVERVSPDDPEIVHALLADASPAISAVGQP